MKTSLVSESDLVGAWSLETFRIFFTDEREPIFPFGKDAQGLLIYTDSGCMSAILSRKDREPLNASRLENAAKAPSQQKAAAFDSYLSYSGTFYVEHNELPDWEGANPDPDREHNHMIRRGQVVHVVELASVPNTIGNKHVRHVTLTGDQLVLRYDITPKSGITRHYELTWRFV